MAEESSKKLGCDHSHFTLFSYVSNMIRGLFSAVTETLVHPNKNPTPVPLWFAVLSLCTLGAPILVMPVIFAMAHYITRVIHLMKALVNDLQGKNDTRLHPWARWVCLLIAPILLLPLFCSRKMLFADRPEQEATKYQEDEVAKKLSDETNALVKIFALPIVGFASLGVGFIAVSAVATTTLAASIGGAIWLFFVAGFLSEWQTLELSVRKFITNLFLTGDPTWINNIDADHSQGNDNKRVLQRLGFIVTVIVAIGLGALTYTHTYSAFIALGQFSSIAISLSAIQVLTPIIATCTALAFGILIFKCVRDAICDANGDDIITKAIDNISSTWDSEDNTALKIFKIFIWSAVYLTSLGLTAFYVLTAGPAWMKSAKTAFQSDIFAKIITYCFYPIYTIFFTTAAINTFDHVIEHSKNLGHSFGDFMAEQAKRASNLFESHGLLTSMVIGLVLMVETLLKIATILTLDVGLTLGMFILHLIGDAAVGAEEEAPFGMSCWSVLLVDSLAHAVLDGGFLLEWALGDLDHKCEDDPHHQCDEENCTQSHSHVNMPYAIFCLTIIGPLLHGLCYHIAKSLGSNWKSPIKLLIQQTGSSDDAGKEDSFVDGRTCTEVNAPTQEAFANLVFWSQPRLCFDPNCNKHPSPDTATNNEDRTGDGLVSELTSLLNDSSDEDGDQNGESLGGFLQGNLSSLGYPSP